jgi:DNA-binding NtrC family response regulator
VNPAGQRVRVLLVDDDVKMVRLVRSILRDDGYDVVGLTNPMDVMPQIASLDPDVVVLDKVMPERDGLDVAEEIRETRPDQPIIIFSSLFDRRLSQETRRLGYVYCEKAGGIDQLEAAIREAIGRAS